MGEDIKVNKYISAATYARFEAQDTKKAQNENNVEETKGNKYLSDDTLVRFDKQDTRKGNEDAVKESASNSYISSETQARFDEQDARAALAEAQKENDTKETKKNKYLSDETLARFEAQEARKAQNESTISDDDSINSENEKNSTPLVEGKDNEGVSSCESIEVNSFDGELSKTDDVQAYLNRLNMKNANYENIYNSLIQDENLSVFDKYKLLQQLEAKGYKFDGFKTYENLLISMSKDCENYSIDDISKIYNKRNEYTYRIEGSDENMQLNYETFQREHTLALVNFYKSGQYEFSQLNDLFDAKNLAEDIQSQFSGENETQYLKDLVSGLPQGDFKITETEPYKTNNIGKNEDYNNLVKVFDHYNAKKLTQEEAAYILAANYGSVDNLINTFRSMTFFHEEEYLPVLIEIMSYQGQDEESV